MKDNSFWILDQENRILLVCARAIESNYEDEIIWNDVYCSIIIIDNEMFFSGSEEVINFNPTDDGEMNGVKARQITRNGFINIIFQHIDKLQDEKEAIKAIFGHPVLY